MIFKLFKFLIFLLSILHPLTAQSAVFRCVAPNGAIEFCDKGCATDEMHQTFLPISYEKTDYKKVLKEEKKDKKAAKKLEVESRKKERLKKRETKKIKAEKAKAERRKIRCDSLNEKIQNIELQLRRGAKEKRFQRLKEDLEHCHQMKLRYCQ